MYWYYNSHGDRADLNPNYLGKARVACEKRGQGECFVFAERRKIVWQNGINPKKGTLIKKKQVQQGMLPQILKELGFYDGGATQTEKIEKKKKKIEKKTTEKSSDDNIVIKLKELKELFDSGALTEEEYKKAKEKLLN